MYLEILLVLVLILVNGLLAMSELAVVSARPARLRLMAESGDKGAGTALELAEDSGKFLSTVQIGITLVGVLSGAFSGATLGRRLADSLLSMGMSPAVAEIVGVGVVVVTITYLSLILGELVPKQLALRHPERIASKVAPMMATLAVVGAPLVFVLDKSGDLVLGLLGQGGDDKDSVTEEEVRSVIADATNAGVLEREEHSMITGVMRLADRSARGLMTPRMDVDFLDLSDDAATIRKRILETTRSRLPVQDGDADSIVGVVAIKDLVDAFDRGKDFNVRSYVSKAPVVLDHTEALDVIKALRRSTVHMALVFDEYGHFEGIVTSGDILEAITGVFREENDEEPAMVTRVDGSLLVAGWMPVDEFADQLGLSLPRDTKYETVAGYVLSVANHLPKEGEIIETEEWNIEVVDLDGHRIDRVIMHRKGDAPKQPRD
ncbi:hemolysin [Devosia pacifica]|uniref:Hemolysin n=1 Tax=Devosia pacifica TaxID=1335967 RepID=A0A918VW47_9HYPH|nr:hemolysin family protein [Devosia pacifica]GHA35205.1 hemolysin [Devosia pacifica]